MSVLNLHEYQALAQRTAQIDPDIVTARFRVLNEPHDFKDGDASVPLSIPRLDHAALGIASEGGELAGAVKAWLHYGRPLDRRNIIEELGDVLWYVAEGAAALGVTLDDVAAANVRKLAARYPGAFDEAAANLRDLVVEARALDGA
jgi:NTP pyrophosphatase (non-canonical NTP hydrolase)